MSFRSSPCTMCRGTGRKRLRRRARGKGTRRGPCPFCEGKGLRWDTGTRILVPFPELTPDVLFTFFYGNEAKLG